MGWAASLKLEEFLARALNLVALTHAQSPYLHPTRKRSVIDKRSPRGPPEDPPRPPKTGFWGYPPGGPDFGTPPGETPRGPPSIFGENRGGASLERKPQK